MYHLISATLRHIARNSCTPVEIAIPIKRVIQHHLKALTALQVIEAFGITLILTRQGPITVMSIYKLPSQPLTLFDLDLLLVHGIPAILCGDFNCKHPVWNSRVAYRNGYTLHL
ncbi:hypothetical protein Zmor_008885 [Zophobas morio]|uniref:Endonuclease/exonuclease/phosphatase domain-containing protein n=1 Tax=Zophobas morio TaxID=2755281 RepID=A0AA38HK27_9CUCU|nr:hypothetical protein Zmor_008885 [Zophobas morio]